MDRGPITVYIRALSRKTFAGLSAGRRREKFTPVEAENWAFCQ
jgi:hypothetical protein